MNILSLFLVKMKLFFKKVEIFLKIKKEEPNQSKKNNKTDDIYPLW